MIDKSRTLARARAPGTLPDFTPVPRRYARHDGWTDERQRGFIEALADTGSVRAAAHRVNMTPEGAYHLRRHAEAASFRAAWDAALALGVQQLEDIAMERALHGTEVPVYSYGKLVGSRVVHNDRLMMFMLRNRAPTRFAADSRPPARAGGLGDPALANQLSRLKRKWRKEWEAEQAAQPEPGEAEVYEALDAKLEAMHQNWLATMSPRVRTLHDAWQAAIDEEAAEKAARDMRGVGPKARSHPLPDPALPDTDGEPDWPALPPPDDG